MSANQARDSDVGEAFRLPATSELPPWMPVRKRNRLPTAAYRAPGSFFITASTADRRPWFRHAAVADHCIAQLRVSCESEAFELIAYSFMPEHVHFLVRTEAGSDLVRLVHRFKQRTGWWFRNRYAAGGLKASPTRANGDVSKEIDVAGGRKASPTRASGDVSKEINVAGGRKASPTRASGDVSKGIDLAGGLKASPTSAGDGLWQKSYYDHVLRRDEDIPIVARYIVENPVRAGLASAADEYAHAWCVFGVPELV